MTDKIITLRLLRCNQCPHVRTVGDRHGCGTRTESKCRLMDKSFDRQVHRLTEIKIPVWCPLDNATPIEDKDNDATK